MIRFPASITLIAGDGQKAPKGTDLSIPLQVIVINKAGLTIQDSSVSFSPAANSVNVDLNSVKTDQSQFSIHALTFRRYGSQNRMSNGNSNVLTFYIDWNFGGSLNNNILSGIVYLTTTKSTSKVYQTNKRTGTFTALWQ